MLIGVRAIGELMITACSLAIHLCSIKGICILSGHLLAS